VMCASGVRTGVTGWPCKKPDALTPGTALTGLLSILPFKTLIASTERG
jgi:hypothetical protein